MADIWLIYDTVKQRQSAPLTTVQAQTLFLRVKAADRFRLHIWTPGWKNWQPLESYLRSSQTDFVMPPEPSMKKPVVKDLEKTVKVEVLDDELTKTLAPLNLDEDDANYTTVLNDEMDIETAKSSYFFEHFEADHIDPHAKSTFKIKLTTEQEKKNGDRRDEVRHHFKIEVILVNKQGRSFRTYSENISMGGTLLQDDLPKEFLNSNFDLILVNKFEKDPVRGRLHFVGKVVGDYRNPRRLTFLQADPHMKERLSALLKAYATRRKESRRKAG